MVKIKTLKEAEFRKPMRTLSGVTPVAVMVKPRACPSTCLYCPSLNAPQSYTPASPAVMRAARCGYDSFKQIKSRLKAYKVMKHPTDKIELIIMGGTFLRYPIKYQREFVKRCYDALNCKNSKDLDEAIKRNEKAKHRCIGLCFETRPDVCGEKEIKLMRGYGATRCELGVQILDNKIYKKNKRGHTIKEVIIATKLLKDAGFKVGYHMMPGMYGSNSKKDYNKFKLVFTDEKFKPDQLKIYPTQVIKGSELEKVYKEGKYEPYSENVMTKLVVKMLKFIPEYCRVMRVMRELPEQYLEGLTYRTDLRAALSKQLRDLKEIRAREVGFVSQYKEIKKDLKIKVLEYKASFGKEYFISVVNSDNVLFGLARLRITDKSKAILRELHVYGKEAKFGGKTWQHIGLGKELMRKVEQISRKYSKDLDIISGIGVREYYRKLGYKLVNGYMNKKLIN